MKVDVQRLRELLAKAQLPWAFYEAERESGITGSDGVSICATVPYDSYAPTDEEMRLIAEALNALPELLAIAEAYNAGREVESDDDGFVFASLPTGGRQTVRLVRVVGE